MRLLVRLLSCLLGLAVAAGGALLALEVAWAWIWPGSAPLLVPWPQWRDGLAQLRWADTSVLLVAGGVALAGLLLLLFSATARRRDVRLLAPQPEVTVSTTPRSLARLVGQRVRDAPGVTGASVTASARRIRVRASSKLRAEHELRPVVLEVVTEVVDALPLSRKPKVSVVVNSPRDRS